MEEHKVYLGWLFNFKYFTISLPAHKIKTHDDCIANLLETGKVTDPKQLEKLIGRLNTIGQILPASRHFLSQLRRRHRLAVKGDMHLLEAEI